jgi:glycosyltransferase involved in cell wall biosynthesis
MYFLERETLRKHRCWIGVSQFILDHNQKIFLLKPKLARVIYNFAPVINCVVDTTIPVGFGSYVVFIGKVTVAKGALDLAKAASIFLKKKEDIKIVYIGADGYRRGESVKELVLATIPTEFRDRVLFLGRRPHSEVIGWIKESIAVVLPSHLEAFSMVPLEAMAVGTPVIYTKLSSGPEVITSGEDGLLVDPHNYEEISSAVLLLANNYGFREKVSEQGRSKVNRLFSIEKCIDESVNFYREIINRNTYD